MKTKIRSTGMDIASVIFCLLPSLVNGQVHQPELQIPFSKTAPRIDGTLGDVGWKTSAALSEFVEWSLDRYIKDECEVFLCYDEKNLYIAFRNPDPEAENLNESVDATRPRDTFLWGRNHVRVSIKADQTSLQLIADPKNTQSDWKNGDINWNGEWQYRASINKTDWTAEFSIPLDELDLKNIAGDERLSITLSRSFPGGESAEWHGVCTLSRQSRPVAQFGKWPAPAPGESKLPFTAHNSSDRQVQLECDLELIPLKHKPEFIDQEGQGPSSSLQITTDAAPLHFTTRYSIPPGKTIAEEIPFELPVEGSYYASATAKLMDGTLVRRTVDYWFTIEPNRKDLALLRARTGESLALMVRASNPLAARLRTEAMEILSRLDGLERSAATKWQTGKWDELTAEVRRMDGNVARHLHQVRSAALHNWKVESDFGISLTHSVIKLRKDGLFPLPLTEQIDLSMARNEYESFQLAILPFGKDLHQVNIDVSDLTNKEGNVIENKRVEVSRVEYNRIDWRAAYVTEYEGWHPDPLIPYRSGLNISGDEVCRPFWITVYAPPGTRPGEYSGTVSVTAAGLKKMTAIIRCRVWDFDLPVASHLKTHSWDQLSYLRDFYNLSEYPVEWYERFCELLLKNRFNPGSAGVNYVSQEPDGSGQYDFSAVEKVLGFCIERGLTRFSIIQMKKGLYTDEEAAKAFRFVDAYARFLRRKGWLDKALVELWDEPTDLEWPYIKERAERLKQIDKGLRLQLFAEGGPYDFWDKRTDQFGLNKLVDIWAPVNSVEAPQAQAEGKEVWAYFCTLARESAPNFYIDCPAIYQRSIAWYCWMYGLDGFEHWGSNYFWRNVRKGRPMSEKWPNVPWDSRTYFNYNGEGQLVYPGPDGVPYSSIRLENFRDSMEDYEYLFRLKELLSNAGNGNANAHLDEYRQLLLPENYLLYKYPRDIKVTLEHTLRYPDQPERFLDARMKIAQAIEQLQKDVPSKP